MPQMPQIAETNINPLADYAAASQAQAATQYAWNTLAPRTRLAQDQADSADQDLADRSTLRGYAAGLASRDPSAVANSVVLKGGASAVNALSGLDSAQAQRDLARAQFEAMIPHVSGIPVGGDPSAGAPSGGAAPGDGTTVPGLSSRESSNNPTAVNADGYSGMFQHGTARLNDLGLYTAAPGEDLKTNQWRGTFNIPGFPDVKTQADYLKNPDAQRAAMAIEVANTDQAIAQTPGADQFNVNGLRAVSHLGGIAGMQKFVATGGHLDRADKNGTTLQNYYQRFSQGGAPALQAAFGHPDGPPGAPPATAASGPGVTLAPGAPAPAPGPQMASRGPMPGDTASDAGGVAPAVGGAAPPSVAAGSEDIDAVMARLRASNAAAGRPTEQPAGPAVAAAPSAIPNQNPLATLGQPGAVPTPATPNALAADPSRPQLMSAASAQPLQASPPAAPSQAPSVTAQPATGQGVGTPPAGARLLTIGLAQLPFTTGAQPGNAWYQLPNGTRQQFRDPGQPQTLTIKDAGNVRSFYSPGGDLVRQEAIPDTRRALQSDENGMHVVRNADGQVMSSTPVGEYKIATEAYGRDSKEIAGIADAGHAAQQDNIRVQAMRDAMNDPTLLTGSGGAWRAKVASFVQTYFPSQAADFVSKIGHLPDAAVAEEFSKMALKGAGTQERQTLGARGGYQAIQLFKSTNPGLDLMPNANRAILGMQLIGNQADADYSLGAQKWFNANEDSLASAGGKYSSLAHYDQQWQQQRQPQIYAAAMGALAGLPASDGQAGNKAVKGWANGLSDDEYHQALQIVSRADPSSIVNAKSGRISMQPTAASIANARALRGGPVP